MVEAEVVPENKITQEQLQESFDAVRAMEAEINLVSANKEIEEERFDPVAFDKRFEQHTNWKFDPNVGSGSALNPRNVEADELRKIATAHDAAKVGSNMPLYNASIAGGPVTFRILPPAQNHEVFARREIRGKPHYFYNVVVRGNDKNPQLLCVPESIHRKIVESFVTKDGDYDCSDLVEGCDFQLKYIEPYHELVLDKGPRCHAGTPSDVSDWLRRTIDLQAHVEHVDKQEKLYGKQEVPDKKLVSFSLDNDVHDNLVNSARDASLSTSAYLNDLLRKQFVDEAGNRQRHFSTGENVRLIDPQKVYDGLASVEKSTKLQWTCTTDQKDRTHRNHWATNLRPEVGDCGEIIGFVMEIKDGNTVPYHNGVAVVRLRKVAQVAQIYVAVSFDGIESLDSHESEEQKTIKVGDWVHWKTQAGHMSVRPSVVFKTRRSKGVSEVQLGYVQTQKIIRFWCPISKCQKMIGAPHGFEGLLAHQLPESLLAQKLRNV